MSALFRIFSTTCRSAGRKHIPLQNSANLGSKLYAGSCQRCRNWCKLCVVVVKRFYLKVFCGSANRCCSLNSTRKELDICAENFFLHYPHFSKPVEDYAHSLVPHSFFQRFRSVFAWAMSILKACCRKICNLTPYVFKISYTVPHPTAQRIHPSSPPHSSLLRYPPPPPPALSFELNSAIHSHIVISCSTSRSNSTHHDAAILNSFLSSSSALHSHFQHPRPLLQTPSRSQRHRTPRPRRCPSNSLDSTS